MNRHLKLFSLFSIAACMSIGGCSCSGGQEELFDFTISLESEKNQLEIGASDKLVITTNGVEPAEEPVYTYEVSDANVCTLSDSGEVYANGLGDVTFTVTEENSNAQATLSIQVVNSYDPANGGFNFAAASGKEAIKTRTEILGSLEKYAMDTHLTGITLFENGGYVKYHQRVKMPTTKYIVGYGFGILSEGELDDKVAFNDDTDYKGFYHTATSSDPLNINAANNDGSQVSDLASYITGSYWSTKMNAKKNGYDWYPQLAKDTVDGKAFNRPIHLEEDNKLGLYKQWKIYVKTGAEEGLKYRKFRKVSTTETEADPEWDKRDVTLEDYEFAYQMLLTGANKMSRGAQMAGDATYGIKGALAYYNATKEMKEQDKIDAVWASMKAQKKLGIETGNDENGSYIVLETVSPIDEFTAMYALSSSLVSPMPRYFIEKIGGYTGSEGTPCTGDEIIKGMKAYGAFNSGDHNEILNYTLCLGAFYIKEWTKRSQIIFERNDDWFEHKDQGRYRIPGVKMRVVTAASQDPNAIYKLFTKDGSLDSTGIPTNYIETEVNKPRVYETKGDSTFKLNVNSCTQEEWDKLFGPEGKMHKGSNWTVKPWMSNEDFLNGLFFSINRPEFAKKRGVQPSINYFSDAYLSNPETGESYNSTEAHKAAVKNFEVYNGEENMYGYNRTRAVNCFKKAVNTLLNKGKIQRGQTIEIDIVWMYASDVTEYGEDIAKYFQDAFNDPAVSNGSITLKVTQKEASGSDWQQVYDRMRQGEFDLGFGAISGNTYNPLNFLEVLKSDNSSTFTLNWGNDTSVIDERHPIVYDEKAWSFDALWSAADHGSVVENGKAVKSVKKSYLDKVTDLSSKATSDLSKGAKFEIPVEFVTVPDVTFSIESAQIYIAGYGNVTIAEAAQVKKTGDGKYVISVTIPHAADPDNPEEGSAEWFNKTMRTVNKIKEEDTTIPFSMGYYNVYWTVEIYYSLSIKGGIPSQNYVTASKNKAAADAEAAKQA